MTIPDFEKLDIIRQHPRGYPVTANRVSKAATGVKATGTELDLGIAKLVCGLGQTKKVVIEIPDDVHVSSLPLGNPKKVRQGSMPSVKPESNKATSSKQYQASEQPSSSPSNPSKQRIVKSRTQKPSIVQAPKNMSQPTDPKQVLLQLGQMLRPYLLAPTSSSTDSSICSTTTAYKHISIDDEIADSLSNLASSFTAETFLSNAKILKKVVRHHTALLRDHGVAAARHGDRIAITQAQLDMLAARVDVLERGSDVKMGVSGKGKRAEESG